MLRTCTHCRRRHTIPNFSREETRKMEEERQASGIEGVRFAYYRCPCGIDEIFVDIVPMDSEFFEDLEHRYNEMKAVVGRLQTERVKAVVVPIGMSAY
jgi:hypothetical protein